jgi:hypothetical protein
MARFKAKEPVAEVECSACNGTGFPKVKQPVQPGRKYIHRPAIGVSERVGWLSKKNDRR